MHVHPGLQNRGPLEAIKDLVGRHSWMQGEAKTNNQCPYNQKVGAENRVMWPQARECLGVLGEARTKKEGRKAVFSGIQGNVASLTRRCPASRTHSCHFKLNSVWSFVPVTPEPLCNLLSLAMLNMAGSTHPVPQDQQSSLHMTPLSKDLSLPPGTATFLV